jgi:DNA-binding NarL/FixJ family response regulator
MPNSSRSRAVTPTFVALAAPAGLLHTSLISYLHAYPHLRVVRAVTTLEALLSAPDAPIYAQVLVLDAALAYEDLPKALGDLRFRYPAAVFIVLVDSPQQQQSARRAGAHFVLLKGHLGDALRNALEEASAITGKIFNDDVDLRR